MVLDEEISNDFHKIKYPRKRRYSNDILADLVYSNKNVDRFTTNGAWRNYKADVNDQEHVLDKRSYKYDGLTNSMYGHNRQGKLFLSFVKVYLNSFSLYFISYNNSSNLFS